MKLQIKCKQEGNQHIIEDVNLKPMVVVQL